MIQISSVMYYNRITYIIPFVTIIAYKCTALTSKTCPSSHQRGPLIVIAMEGRLDMSMTVTLSEKLLAL